MLYRVAFTVAFLVCVVSSRPQSGVENVPTISIEVSTGTPQVIVPVKISVKGQASSSSDTGATGNIDSPSVLNPVAPVEVTDAQVFPTVQPVVVDQEPIVTLAETTTIAPDIVTDGTTVAVTEARPAPVQGTTILVTFTNVPRSAINNLGEWQRGATYSIGDEVTYSGGTYRARQRHTADGLDWTPPQTPNLWLKVLA